MVQRFLDLIYMSHNHSLCNHKLHQVQLQSPCDIQEDTLKELNLVRSEFFPHNSNN